MSIETINYLLAKYYEILTSTQYLYQNELKEPSVYLTEEVDLKIRYKIEIQLLERLIEKLEELKDSLNEFSF